MDPKTLLRRRAGLTCVSHYGRCGHWRRIKDVPPFDHKEPILLLCCFISLTKTSWIQS